jgi:hypothetical protein
VIYLQILKILTRWKNYFCQLLHLEGAGGARQTEIQTGFWWVSLKERDHSVDRGIDGRKGSEWILDRLVGGLYSGPSWLRIEAGGTRVSCLLC